MVNKSKALGTAAETAIVRWLKVNGFPHADRQPLRGGRDQGDLVLAPGLVAEVKWDKGNAKAGQPEPKMLAGWMEEAAVERANAGADYCPLFVRRGGTTDVGRWWCYMTLGDFNRLVASMVYVRSDGLTPICMDIYTATRIFRTVGWGEPLDNEPGTDHSKEAEPST